MRNLFFALLLLSVNYLQAQSFFEAAFDTFPHIRERQIGIADSGAVKRVLLIENRYGDNENYTVTQVLGDKELTKTVSIIQGRYYTLNDRTVWVVGDDEEKVMVPKMIILGEHVLVLVKSATGIYTYGLASDLKPIKEP